MIVLRVHVTDACNQRCPSCHWFGCGPITECPPPRPEDVLALVERLQGGRPLFLVLTGGEPTLWEPLPDVLSSLPRRVRVAILTNGILAERLLTAKRVGQILLNVRPETDLAAIKDLRRRGWEVCDNPLPEEAPRNQFVLANGYRHLLGKSVQCRGPWRFATDGCAYACEIGVREKDPALRLPVTFREGTIQTDKPAWRTCKVGEACLSALGCEQAVKEASQ